MEELKVKGNEAFQGGKYAEAVELYTQAIELEENAILYSNRSSAYLKLEKYYEANSDAEKSIILNASWSKGFFRKAEVLSAIGLYEEALSTYQLAQMMHQKAEGGPDYTLTIKMLKCLEGMKNKMKYEKNFPWLCAGVGLIFAVVIVVADYSLTKTPALSHVLLQSLFVMVISGLGALAGKAWIWHSKNTLKQKIQPTIKQQEADSKNSPQSNGSTGDAEGSSEKSVPHVGPRYTKAQARHRFRKGKS